jgi:hypothetical protein
MGTSGNSAWGSRHSWVKKTETLLVRPFCLPGETPRPVSAGFVKIRFMGSFYLMKKRRFFLVFGTKDA